MGIAQALSQAHQYQLCRTSASLTDDGKTIFFASERKGGEGQADLWMAERVSRSVWGEPVNLGPAINTPLDEIGVWCNGDGTVLYFASDGHLSLGGYDVFRTEKVNGVWTAPVNLGYPLNTVANELHFSMSRDAKQAFYISQSEDGYGSYDIHQVDLSMENLLDGKMAFRTQVQVKGTIYNSKGKGLNGAQIVVTSLTSGKKLKTVTADRKGEYMVEVPAEGSYTLTISKENYTTKTETVKAPAGVGDAGVVKLNVTL